MSEINWSQLDELYKKSTIPGKAAVAKKIPAGKYLVKIYSVDFRVSEKGNPYMFWVLEIMEGEFAGRNLLKQNMLVNEKNMGFFKKDIAICGVEPPNSLAEFADEEATDNFKRSMHDIELRVTLKIKDGHDNVYIDHLLSGGLNGGKPSRTASTDEAVKAKIIDALKPKPFDDDDIPF